MQIKMKIIRLFSIFVRLSFIFSILIKDDPQVSLGTIQDSEMTSSDVDPILEYPQNFEMSSTDICINLKEMLLAFGSNSTDLYKTCDYSYHLLGYDNSVIKSAMPLCFLNIADVFCAFDIVFIKEKFDQNLKNKVLKNLNGCSKNSGKETLENYYKCPTLNHQTLLIEDEGEFCSKLESKSTEISDGNKNLEIENEESRVYTFVKKEEKGKCKVLASLFNFCIKGLNLIMPSIEKSECYDSRFPPYSGSYIKKYNEISRKKCEDFVLPHFLFKSREIDMVEPGNEDFCVNILYDIRKTLNTRIEEIIEKSQNETNFQQLLKEKIQTIEKIANKSLLLVSNIVKTEEIWSDCYSNLKTTIQLKRPIKTTLLKNFQILKDVIVNSISIGNAMTLSIASQIFIATQISENYDYFKTQIDKINGSLLNLESVCEAIINIIIKTNDVSKISNSLEVVTETQELTENNLDELHNWIIDTKADFELVLTAIKNKILQEKKLKTELYQKSFQQYSYYEKIRVSLNEQKEINSQYTI